MNVDFSAKKDGGGNVTQETQPVTTPAGDKVECVNTYNAPARRADVFQADDLPPLADIILPRVNLVASVGGLKDSFKPGSFVFDQRTVLHVPTIINSKTHQTDQQGTPPVIITVLRFKPTRFVQNVKGGGRGLICDTPEQVTAAGGTLDYQEFKLKEASGILRFDYMAEAFIAIERPADVADDDTVFCYEVDGKKYALGLYAMKASAYTVAKRTLFTPRRMGYLKDGYPTRSLALSSELAPTPDKTSTFWRPVIVPNEKSTPAFLSWVDDILGKPVQEKPDDSGE